MNADKNTFLELKKRISKEVKIAKELESLSNSLNKSQNKEERDTILSHIKSLKSSLKDENQKSSDIVEKISLTKKLNPSKKEEVQNNEVETEKKSEDENKKAKTEKKKTNKKNKPEKISKNEREQKESASELEKEAIKRFTEEDEKKEGKKKGKKKPSIYAKISSRFFSDISESLSKERIFDSMKRDLLRTNLSFIPPVYVSMILFTTILSFAIAFIVFLFLLFFNISNFPNITFVENILGRFVKIFWILFIFPIGTFLFMYFYPSMEKSSLESKINQEIPFAAIHMSSISGSMIEPTNIFKIIISTKEYPNLEKEFIKLMNQINIYGYDLVTALRDSAINSPSKKLSELYNGLATTITSGGDLSNFFDKRSESLLLDYRLERERYTKSAETFIDIYISVVIAAPMILMLLLMMIQISGLGLSISPGTITLIMVLGVAMINFAFLVFLHLKQPAQ